MESSPLLASVAGPVESPSAAERPLLLGVEAEVGGHPAAILHHLEWTRHGSGRPELQRNGESEMSEIIYIYIL